MASHRRGVRQPPLHATVREVVRLLGIVIRMLRKSLSDRRLPWSALHGRRLTGTLRHSRI